MKRIEPPHYFAGELVLWGKWQKLTPGRMSYEAGYREFRWGRLTREPWLTVEFR